MLQITSVIKQVFSTAWNSLSFGNIAGNTNRSKPQRKRRLSQSDNEDDFLCDHIEEEETTEIPLRKRRRPQLLGENNFGLISTPHHISNISTHSALPKKDLNTPQRELWSYVVGKPAVQQKLTVARRLSIKMARRQTNKFSRSIKGSATNHSFSKYKMNQNNDLVSEHFPRGDQDSTALLPTSFQCRDILDDHPVPVHDNHGYIKSPLNNRIPSTTDGVIRLEERQRFSDLVKMYSGRSSTDDLPENKPFNTRFSDVKDILGRIQNGIVNEALEKPTKKEKTIEIDGKDDSTAKTISGKNPIKIGSFPKDILSTPEFNKNLSTNKPKDVANILDSKWISQWKQALSPDNLAREREISVLESEVDKLESERHDGDISKVIKRRIEDETDKDPGLNPLTIEEQDQIDDVLDIHDPRHTVSEMQTASITRGDLDSLSDLNWLNDEVINGFMCLLKERSKANKKLPQIHTFNTFFYPKLLKTKHQSVKRWTKKVDLFSLDLVLIPIHLGVHWCLAAIDFRNREIKYFDSMKGNNNRCIDELRQYLEAESIDKKQKPFDFTGWQMLTPKNIPEQMNGCDCGVFACKYAECLSRNGKFSFSQNDMPLIRQRLVHSLITKIV